MLPFIFFPHRSAVESTFTAARRTSQAYATAVNPRMPLPLCPVIISHRDNLALDFYFGAPLSRFVAWRSGWKMGAGRRVRAGAEDEIRISGWIVARRHS